MIATALAFAAMLISLVPQQALACGGCFSPPPPPGRQNNQLILQDAERGPEDAVFSVGNHITLHSVAIRPHQHAIWVAHGRSPSAHYGGYVKYDLRELLKR